MKNITVDEIMEETTALQTDLQNSTSLTLRMAVVPPIIGYNTHEGEDGIVSFASELAGSNGYAYTTCNFTETFVETQILCVGRNCTASKMRVVSNP